MQLVLAIHAAATLSMTGLIWFVQVVHYPLLANVPATSFVEYERQHVRRTTWVVAPLMLAEVATAALLPALVPPGIASALAWAGVLLVGVAWASTMLLQVPCHRRLRDRFDAAVLARLVRSNWIRTAAWSARGVLAAALVSAGVA